MQNFINEQEYIDLLPRLQARQAHLVVPRQVARNFFLRTSNHAIKQATGQSALVSKLIIWIGVITAPLLFLIAAIYFIMDSGWAATVMVPLLGIFWTIIAGLTGDQGSFLQGTLAMIAGAVLAAILPTEYAIPLALIIVSLWVQRNIFFIAEYFLLHLISQSFAAFDMLIEHIEIVDIVPTEPEA
ncbi:MAG: hypothetical protein QNL99_16225 [SAR86 cluster bacterium]|jgi:hypothetical protein|tara:strand:+ start:2946 stop:3500 length:555 start_codon:yes stop_codon:yes gene_type:complete